MTVLSTERRRLACPSVAAHTDGPDGYLTWHEWAEKMVETHTQHRCPGCGLWLIYRPKKAA